MANALRMSQVEFDAHQKRVGGTDSRVAQSGERRSVKARVAGSKPASGAKKSETEEMLARDIGLLCKDYPQPVRQYKYLPDRKYKGDFVYPGLMTAIEVDGSVHRIKQRFAEDCRRQNELKFAGWHVFRVTGAMVRSGEAIKVVLRALDWAERRRRPI